MANESIWLLSEPSLVRCRTLTLVIFWPVRVSCTCIGPYGVLAAAPVTVRAVVAAGAVWLRPAAGLLGPGAGGGREAGALDVGEGDGVAGAASAAAGTWVLKDSSAARPAAVPARVRTARSMKPPVRQAVRSRTTLGGCGGGVRRPRAARSRPPASCRAARRRRPRSGAARERSAAGGRRRSGRSRAARG